MVLVGIKCCEVNPGVVDVRGFGKLPQGLTVDGCVGGLGGWGGWVLVDQDEMLGLQVGQRCDGHPPD